MKRSKSKWNWARSSLLGLIWLSASFANAQQQLGQLEGEFRLNGKETWKAFEPIREVLQASSAVIYDGWRSVAYGVVVSSDGYLVSKASEIDKIEELTIRIDRRHFKKVEVVAAMVEWDVVLLKVDGEDLPLIDWSETEPTHGSWVVSNGSTTRRDRRLRVGIISANAREIGGGRAPVVMGVTLNTNEETEGLAIGKVHKDSGASQAGLEPGDIILKADGVEVKNMKELQVVLKEKEPGDTLNLRIKRGNEEREYDVELKKRESVFEEEKTRNDAMSGRVSQRRSNFPRVLQTDLPLSVRSVGGPLLDLEGRCIGMNIARANRCETFSIPTKELLEIVQALMNPAQEEEASGAREEVEEE